MAIDENPDSGDKTHVSCDKTPLPRDKSTFTDDPQFHQSTSRNPPPLPSNPSDDPTSPFFIHFSDNPGLRIIYETFVGTNYTSWSRVVIHALSVKNKVVFINSSLPCPPISLPLERAAWIRVNSLVLSWLMASISNSIRQTLIFHHSAQELWDDLKIRYARSDGPRVYQLEKLISSISQGNMNSGFPMHNQPSSSQSYNSSVVNTAQGSSGPSQQKSDWFC